MRYIGNKTRLLGFIGDTLRRRGIAAGTALDPFSGTASVARALKAAGFHVTAADIMEYAYTFARADVELAALPDYAAVAGAVGARPAGLQGVVAYLNDVAPWPGFLHEHFSPAGQEGRRHGRMYFTPENAARIDTIRGTIEEWRRAGMLDEDGYHLLLAELLRAADRVANTAGVYAACIKSWQPNARNRLGLRIPEVLPGNGCQAVRRDALALVEAHPPVDLLYLDPPYNGRQYVGYYHIPELLALGWFNGPIRLRGKTGLLPADPDKRSDWSRRGRCEEAFERLVATARWRRLVMSYNAEGIIPESTIARVLKTYGRAATYRRYTHGYRRYRSDSDGDNRRYRGDAVKEFLYCVDR